MMLQYAKRTFLYATFKTKAWVPVHHLYRAIYPLPARVLFSHQVISEDHRLANFMKAIGNLSVRQFDRRIAFLSKHYQFLSLDEYACLYRERRKPPFPGLILTFDDGHSNLYSEVFPILKKYKIPAAVFLTTGCIGNHNVMINDQLIYMLSATSMGSFRIPELSPKLYYTRTGSERLATFEEISSQLKKIPNYQKTQIIEKMRSIFRISIDDINKAIQMLTWQEIKEMHESGLVLFGAHTETHPILTKIPLDQAIKEIQYPKKLIEQHIGREIRYFAYPNGSVDDYDQTIIEIIRQSGYDLAFTTNGFTGLTTYNPYEIPRYGFEQGDSLHGLTLRLSGFNDIIKLLSKKSY